MYWIGFLLRQLNTMYWTGFLFSYFKHKQKRANESFVKDQRIFSLGEGVQ